MTNIYWTDISDVVSADRLTLNDLKDIERNLQYLKDPAYASEYLYYSSPGVPTIKDYSIASATWAEVEADYWEVDFEYRGGIVLVTLQVQFVNSNATTIGYVDIKVDDDYFLGGEDGLMFLKSESYIGYQRKEVWAIIEGLTPGQHRLTVWAKRKNTGTVTLRARNNALNVVELFT